MKAEDLDDEDQGIDPTDCIAACEECSRSCLQHVPHCLELGGEHAQPDHIGLLLGCAAVCRTAVELMSLGSDWSAAQCEICAQICEECAEHCAQMEDMEDCAASCRACAEACRQMLGNGVEEDVEEGAVA